MKDGFKRLDQRRGPNLLELDDEWKCELTFHGTENRTGICVRGKLLRNSDYGKGK